MTERTDRVHAHGSVQRAVVEAYEEKLMGIPLILFNAIEQEKCEGCGDVLKTTIPDFEGLVSAVAVTRIKHALKLDGTEIKFLRKALGVTAKKLAGDLEVTPETFSRWENGKDPIGPTSEKLLRTFVGDELSINAPAIYYDPKEIRELRILPVRGANETLVIAMVRVDMKVKPSLPRTTLWGEQEKKIA